MFRTLTRIIPAATCLALAACNADVLGPDVEIPDAQFLIGQSPLRPISLDPSTDPPTMRIPVTLGTNGAKIAEGDLFVLQSAVGIWDVTDRPLGEITAESRIADATIETALREGAKVDMESWVGLHDVWATIEAKSKVYVVATVELVRESRDGSRQVLDSMTREGTVEPSNARNSGGK